MSDITYKQQTLINKMSQYCPPFTGSTRKDAQQYITEYIDQFQTAQKHDSPGYIETWALVHGYD